MTKDQAKALVTVYGEAWMERDLEKILTVFTPDATYFDPREKEVRGHDGIRKYWQTKVLNNQTDITFNLLNLWVDGDTVIAEWKATFTDLERQMRIDLTEVAIFAVRGEQFSSLREYYWSAKTSL